MNREQQIRAKFMRRTNNPVSIEQRSLKIEQMLEMYSQGNTLETIGKKFGVTRERIRQVLVQFPEYRRIRESKAAGPWRTIICENVGCSREITTRNPLTKCCSYKCSGRVNRKWATIEERNAYYLQKKRERYASDPEYRKKIREITRASNKKHCVPGTERYRKMQIYSKKWMQEKLKDPVWKASYYQKIKDCTAKRIERDKKIVKDYFDRLNEKA